MFSCWNKPFSCCCGRLEPIGVDVRSIIHDFSRALLWGNHSLLSKEKADELLRIAHTKTNRRTKKGNMEQTSYGNKCKPMGKTVNNFSPGDFSQWNIHKEKAVSSSNLLLFIQNQEDILKKKNFTLSNDQIWLVTFDSWCFKLELYLLVLFLQRTSVLPFPEQVYIQGKNTLHFRFRLFSYMAFKDLHI